MIYMSMPQPPRLLGDQIGFKIQTDLVSMYFLQRIIWFLTGVTHYADTMDAHNVSLSNFIFQGGDDCVAIKPRSYNIQVRNVTCRGGNGIAIGSLGQYLEDSSVVNVTVSDVKVSERRYLRLSSNIETDNSVQRRYA